MFMPSKSPENVITFYALQNDKVLECKQENMATLWSWLMQSVKFYNDVLASTYY